MSTWFPIDNLPMRPVENTGPDGSGLPWVTHEGELDIKGCKLTVYQLSDGKRIIDEDSFLRFLAFLGIEEPRPERRGSADG